MYPIPPSETLVENQTCSRCATVFPITDKDMEFYEKVSPIFGGKKYQIPKPTLCPDCRQQRRESWHNEKKVYKRTCAKTGKSIFSMYHEKSPYTIVSSDYWWSDAWDGLEYGRDIDFSKSFFSNFDALLRTIPIAGTKLMLCENCDYCDNLRASKDCYYAFNGGWGTSYFENAYYTVATGEGVRNVVDTFWTTHAENSYELVHVHWAYGSSWCYNCNSITDCQYLRFCHGCTECTLCEGIQNKKHHFMNIAYSEEEYKQKKSEFMQLSARERMEKLQAFSATIPKKQDHNTNCENISGDYIIYSSTTYNSFFWWGMKDCKYLYNGFQVNDSMDCYNYGVEWSLCYEVFNSNRSHNILFGMSCLEQSTHLIYCDSCISCTYCFGCSGLKNKSYCILNKQYTKEEYEKLVPKIIEKMKADEEWGEFFPASISPFGYNETVANDYLPLSREVARKGWYNWSDYESPLPKVEKVIKSSLLPEDISQIPDDILNWAIECEVSGKPFRIIRQELAFYRKHHLPIPKRHPDVRHMDRMKMRNPRKLFERKCDKCTKNMITTYSPERSERVYCEECYNQEVIN